MVRQMRFRGDAAHLGLGQFPQREKNARELRLVEPVQEVALVFRLIDPAMKFK